MGYIFRRWIDAIGIDHDADNKVFMLPISFSGSPVSILTANIDGTQLHELVDLDNSGSCP